MSTYALEVQAEQSDQSSAIIVDTTVYSGEARMDKANFLVVSKNDKSGIPTYLTIDNTHPLTVTEWVFATLLDGWYQFIMLRLTLYSTSPVSTVQEIVDGSGNITQYATVLYHTPTGKVVKALTTGVITVQPGATGWQTYWADLTNNLSALANYGSIVVTNYSDLIDAHLRDKLRDAVDVVNSKPWSNNPFDRSKLYEKQFEFEADLNGLQVLNASARYSNMEEQTRYLYEMWGLS